MAPKQPKQSSIENSTITVKTSVAIVVAAITVLGNHFGTRLAVSLELLQLKNDIQMETQQRKSEDEKFELKLRAIYPGTVTTFR